MKLFRDFFEGKGWPPERLAGMTPKQLMGLAGGAEKRAFGSVAEAAAAYRREHGDE